MTNEFCQRFDEVVSRQGKHPAIECDGETALRYEELQSLSLEIASQLAHQHEGAQQIVAIDVGKTPAYIAALIAIWRVGGAAIPIAPDVPRPVVNALLLRGRARLIVQLDADGNPVVQQLPQTGLNGKKHSPLPHDLAYLIFTSGSTGRPKGVLVGHRGLVPMLDEQINAFRLGEATRSLFYLSIAFDASLSDIGTALLSGGTLVMDSDLTTLDAQSLFHRIHLRGITYADLPPSVMTRASFHQIHAPNSLKTVVIGGEVCPTATVDWWSNQVRLVNVYGPTEATVCTSWELCKRHQVPSIGSPIASMEYRIENEVARSPTQPIEGELWISGPGIAHGYLDDDTLTSHKFVEDNGKRWYRTGDQVVRQRDGRIYFVGRMDQQFKLLGRLVEPQEIQSIVLAIEGVHAACVIPLRDKNGSIASVAIAVEASSEVKIDQTAIRSHCRKHLPEWMIPSTIRIDSKLPKTPTGKIDQHQIAQQMQSAWARLTAKRQPNSTIDHLLSKSLGHSNFVHTQTFYEAGGNSLAALELLASAHQCGVEIDLSDLAIRPLREIGVKPQRSHSMSTTDLDRHVNDQRRRIKFANRSCPRPSHATLLTGASGFLGTWFLERWLRSDLPPITCLVRAVDASTGLEKINQSRSRYLNQAHPLGPGDVKIICGDLAKENAGIESKQWDRLCETMTHIVHLAAEVHLLDNFDSLRTVNFDSLTTIANLASTGIRKPIHAASTLSVFVASDHPGPRYIETDSFVKEQTIYGGYAQSKWAADRLLLKSMPEQSAVYRFGLLTGSTINGVCPPRDQLAMVTRGLVELKCYPKLTQEAAFDVTPVDQAANCMVNLVAKDVRKAFHICSPQPISLNRWVSILESLGHRIEQVSIDEFLQQLASKDSSVDFAATELAFRKRTSHHQEGDRFSNQTDLFLATNITFDRSRVEQELDSLGKFLPPVSDSYLQQIASQMLKNHHQRETK